MTRTFIQTREFSRRWEEFGLNDDDLRLLELDIMTNPHKYPVMKSTGGLRKARIPIGNRGKSGSARVCYVDFTSAETVYLITVYEKNEKDNLTMHERNIIKIAIEKIAKDLGGK